MKHLRSLALLLLTALFLTAASACAAEQPPALEEVKAEFTALLEQAFAVNDLLFGAGVPYYETDSPFAVENHLYDGSVTLGDYRYAAVDTPYRSANQIRAFAESVYSKDYLSDIEGQLFEGSALISGGTAVIGYARYLDSDKGLLVLSTWSNGIEYGAHRVFDYDSMKILSGSQTAVRVEICWTSADTEGVTASVLRFVKETSGWRLDTPTY